jgi:hypothetical protein
MNLKTLTLCALGAALVACGGEGASESPAPVDPSTAAPDKVPADLQVFPIDLPSPQAIVLQWNMDRTGATSLSMLDVVVTNTSDETLDVELHAVSMDRGQSFRLPSAVVRVPAKASIDQSIAVDSLAVQLVDASVQTAIYGVFRGNDGSQRVAPTAPVWVTHEAGFRTARVRGQAEEANHNAGRGLSRLLKVERPQGRILERAGSFMPIDASTLSGGATQRALLVSQLPGMPDARNLNGAAAEPDESVHIDKAGSYSICVKVPHLYIDGLGGEDFLLSSLFATGELYEPARYMYYAIFDGTNWREGHLNSSGCTGGLQHANGDYAIFVTTKLVRSGVTINITPDDTQQFQYYLAGYNVSGSGGTIDLTMSGVTSWSNAGVVTANALFRQWSAFVSSSVNVYADQNCPPPCGSGTCTACQKGDEIYFGPDPFGLPNTAWKFVVAHEIGHQVQRNRWGHLLYSYTSPDPAPVACQCPPEIPANDNAHCLQSREEIEAAQSEGFGHFFAADGLNNTSQSDCTFVYYKAFRNNNGTVTSPPHPKSCVTIAKWLNNNCASGSTNRGTEYDWMGFFYYLNNFTSVPYSFAELEGVYESACEGTCSSSSDRTPWTDLLNAAKNIHGPTSPKALHWELTGAAYGVNH